MGRLEEIETAMVKDVGEVIGYGRTMQLCEQLWKESLKAKGYSEGGAHSVGPCNASLVDCGCKNPVECDWCCASGRVTKRVKEAKDKKDEATKKLRELFKEGPLGKLASIDCDDKDKKIRPEPIDNAADLAGGGSYHPIKRRS